jgi:hypothetical protein
MLTWTLFWLSFWQAFFSSSPLPVLLPVPPPPRGTKVIDLDQWRRDHPRGWAA